MYQALYRKYRPLSFDEVVGQDIIIRTLNNAVKTNKISHAYLFTGPRGTGKTTIAKILAKTINCENLIDNHPCNKCVSCTQIINKQSTDIVEIDAASNNGVDEIREIRNKVNLVPSYGKYKVYIIDEVHMLTVGAFNALLKTLEEPPAHIIFILATTEPHKIPATILSRCQRFDFKRIAPSKIIERLKIISQNEKLNIEDDALEEIARLSDGGMRDAISMLDQVLAYAESSISINDVHDINGTVSQKSLIELITNILEKNILETMKILDIYNDGGKNFVKLTEEIIVFIKNLLICQTIEEYFENEDKKAIYNNLKNKVSTEELINLIDVFNDNLTKIKQSNDPKIILELLIIKYASKFLNKVNSEQNIVGNNLKLESIAEPSQKLEKMTDNTQEKIELNKELENQIKQPENVVEEKVKKEKTENNTLPIDIQEKLETLKEIRINNTLAKFNRQKFIETKKQLDNIKDFLMLPEYSEIVSTILDGNLKAASDDNLIFVYDSEMLANYFNENLLLIEEVLYKNYNQKYAAIAVSNISWEIIKKEFNNKSKQYVYQQEPFKLNEIFTDNNKKDELNSLFGEIVEII